LKLELLSMGWKEEAAALDNFLELVSLKLHKDDHEDWLDEQATRESVRPQ